MAPSPPRTRGWLAACCPVLAHVVAAARGSGCPCARNPAQCAWFCHVLRCCCCHALSRAALGLGARPPARAAQTWIPHLRHGIPLRPRTNACPLHPCSYILQGANLDQMLAELHAEDQAGPMAVELPMHPPHLPNNPSMGGACQQAPAPDAAVPSTMEVRFCLLGLRVLRAARGGCCCC